ncbi:uncharacterized protein VP01_664g6 [Puccinia sorghi]|uniref:Heme haloperoxidase family profile domain-containing protein n=1 Tax=Puccinia sorghi TaxID=27349 RepID=A0A0L6UF01_9BASI|nr:uncharacterized protein VP01_664g6 [Puccinia sorghi]
MGTLTLSESSPEKHQAQSDCLLPAKPKVLTRPKKISSSTSQITEILTIPSKPYMGSHRNQRTDAQWSELEPMPYNRKKLGSPCPGISILVNHGYLTPANKHDRIKLGELIGALVKCFNLTWFHAAFLSILAVLLCGRGLSVSIWELGTHGPIEHDGSITRYDHASVIFQDFCQRSTRVGDSLNPDDRLIDEFLNTRDHSPHPVSLSDYALVRSELEAFARRPLSLKARMVCFPCCCFFLESNKTRPTALGEVGLIYSIFGNKKDFIDSSSLENIYRYERLPRVWTKPHRPVSIWDVVTIGWELSKKIHTYNKTSKTQSLSEIKLDVDQKLWNVKTTVNQMMRLNYELPLDVTVTRGII